MASRDSANVETILAALESLTDGFWMLDRDWRLTYVNHEAERSSGKRTDELVGRTVWESFPHLAGTPLEAECRRAADKRITVEFEYFHPPSRRWFGVKLFPTQNHAMAFLTRDITRTKRVEGQLSGMTKRLALLVDNTPLAVVEWDADFVITRWSGQAEKVFGWSAEDVVGRRIDAFGLVYEEDIPKVEATMAGLLDPATRFLVSSNRNTTKAGEVIDCEWYNSVLHDEDGRLVAVLSMVLDVTEHNRAVDGLRHQRDLTRNITDNATTAIFMTDRAGRCSFMNPAAEAMTGYSFADVEGRLLHDVIHHHHPDGTPYPSEDCPSLNATDRFEAVDREETFVRRNGEFFPVLVNAKQIRPGGPDAGTVIEVRDVTEQVRAEAALRHADRRKDEFLATLAHELRNPLAPLKNSLDLLRLAKADDLVDHARATMERQVGQMVRLVDDLLDVSRITLDKIELRRERVELATVLRQALESSRPHCEMPRHELRVDVPAEPIYLDADPVRLTQVFSNLLINSCKYTTPGGRISLSAALEGDHVAVTVKDTGVGIPPEMLTRVFDLFTQVGRTLERSAGGLGIGLSLARRLIQMHGGSIEARSAGEGAGSEFVARLPMLADRSTPAKADETLPALEHVPARRILVVDDNLDAATVLAELLTLDGNETSVAHDGIEALKALEAFRPEIVLLDLGLPRLSGREVCRRARSQPWSKSMVFVAVTGWGQEEDRRQSKEAGFDAHLTKPVAYDKLMSLVDSLAKKAHRATA